MELQFNQYNFVYPHNLENANKHALASRIFKITHADNTQKCDCCDRIIGSQEEFGYTCYNPKELLFLGPGIPLYFLFLRQSLFLLLCQLIVFGVYQMAMQGGTCISKFNACSDNLINKFSIINNTQNTPELTALNYLILGCILSYFIILQLIRRQSSKLEHKCHKHIDLPSSYSIMIRRLPQNYTEADIQEMIQKRRQNLTPHEKDITNNLAIQKIVLSYSLRQVNQVKAKNVENFKKMTLKKIKFIPQQLPKPKVVAPLAIVSFQSQASKQYFICEPSTWDKILKCCWSVYLPYSKSRVKGELISIQRAPEPDDIYWENCGISYKGNIFRRLAGKILIFLVLVCAAGIQVALKYVQGRYLSTNLSQLLSICFSIGVTILNFVLGLVLEFIIQKQRLQTVTEQSISLASTISLLQFLNSGVLVMFSNLIINSSNYNLDGLAENVLSIMIINMFAPHLTLLFFDGFKPFKRFQRWRINKSQDVFTQKEVNQAYEGAQVLIALRCVYIIKTVWLTMFYASFVPLVIPISMVGVFAYYHLEKYMFLKHYKIPNMISQELTKEMLDLLDYSPFLLACGNFVVYLYLWYFQILQIPTSYSIPIYVSLFITLIYIFLPTDTINESIFKFKKHQGYKPPYQQVQGNFNTDYDIANPVYHQKNKKNRNNHFFKAFGDIGGLFNTLNDSKLNFINNSVNYEQNNMDNMMIEMINNKNKLLQQQVNPFQAHVYSSRGCKNQKNNLAPNKLQGIQECEQFSIRVFSPVKQSIESGNNHLLFDHSQISPIHDNIRSSYFEDQSKLIQFQKDNEFDFNAAVFIQPEMHIRYPNI